MSSLVDNDQERKVVFIPTSECQAFVATSAAPTPDDYANAANFNKCRFSSISPNQLQLIRNLLLIPNFMQLALTLGLYSIESAIFFLTDWGHLMTVFSLLCVLKASQGYDHW